MLPKRKPTKGVMGTRKNEGPLRCRAHTQWVRGHRCSVPGCEHGPIEAAHISSNLPHWADKGGERLKCGDDWTISLCVDHHRLGSKSIHNMGETSFSKFWQIDVWELAQEFAAKSPALRRLRMKEEG